MSARFLSTHGAVTPVADASATPAWVLPVIVMMYVLPGLVGHDPWKPDEAYVFGVVYDMLRTGDWIVPQVAGVPFMEKPPMYHWTAMLTATLSSPWLPLHDGARLASGVFVLATVAATAGAARLLWGSHAASTAALLTLCPLGLLVHAQSMIADLPLMAGFAIAILGFAACFRARAWGPAMLGIGVGIGFLGKGLIAPCTLAFAALMLPVAFPEWRSKRYARALALALMVAAPFLVIWPALLLLRSRGLFLEWFWQNNVGRFLGFSVAVLGAATESGFWTRTFPWFAFPFWVLLLAGLWRERGRLLAYPGVQVGLTVTGALACVLVSAASARVIYALPLVPALALACTGCALRMPRWIARVLAASGFAFALAGAIVVWAAWAGLAWQGRSPWRVLDHSLSAQFDMPIMPWAIATALCAMIAFGVTTWSVRRRPDGALTTWVASLALVWTLAGTLWLPWIDHAKSYRSMFVSMGLAIPPGTNCVGTQDLGESERAMMHYVLGIRTIPPPFCDAYVHQRIVGEPGNESAEWEVVWSGSRPGDERERFELYVRR